MYITLNTAQGYLHLRKGKRRRIVRALDYSLALRSGCTRAAADKLPTFNSVNPALRSIRLKFKAVIVKFIYSVWYVPQSHLKNVSCFLSYFWGILAALCLGLPDFLFPSKPYIPPAKNTMNAPSRVPGDNLLPNSQILNKRLISFRTLRTMVTVSADTAEARRLTPRMHAY